MVLKWKWWHLLCPSSIYRHDDWSHC